MKKEKINLGCGKEIKEGYINLDFEEFDGVDVIHDLNIFPYPFKTNQFKEILMDRSLEHLDNPYRVMKEIYRIAQKDAVIKIRVPHFSSIQCWGNLQHKRGFSVRTFNSGGIEKDFEVIYAEIEIPRIRFFIKPMVKMFPLFYEKNLAYIFPATDLVVHLKVKKE